MTTLDCLNKLPLTHLIMYQKLVLASKIVTSSAHPSQAFIQNFLIGGVLVTPRGGCLCIPPPPMGVFGNGGVVYKWGGG